MSWCEKILSPLVSNWPLVAVAIWGIVVAIRTLNAIARQATIMEQQTKAAESAANAAMLNAQAVINSERPWIVVSVEKNPMMQPGYFFFRVTNTGRTPAQFISGGFTIDFKTSPNQLAERPNYEPFFAPNNVFLPPGDHFDIKRTSDEANTGINPEKIISSRSLENEPINIADTLFFYGNIIYDDVLGKERPDYRQHETRWCFVFFQDGLRFVRTGPDGSDEYNRYT